HVEVCHDPRPIGERIGRRAFLAARAERAVNPLELGGDRGEGLPFRLGASAALLTLAELTVVRETRGRGGRELGLVLDSPRGRDRAARRLRLEVDAREALDARDEDRSLVEDRGACGAVA